MFDCWPKKCLMAEVSYPEDLEEDCKDLIARLLQRNPDNRPTFEELKSHAWMSLIDFSPETLKRQEMPNWILQHAAVEANPKMIRQRSMISNQRRPKKDLTLTQFIQEMCTQMIDIGRSEAESAAARWMTEPSPTTIELFRGWHFISDDAKLMEMNAMNQNRQVGILRRMRSRRGTT